MGCCRDRAGPTNPGAARGLNKPLGGSRAAGTGERARGEAPRNWGKNVTLISSISVEGVGPSMSIEGPSDGEPFLLYLTELLCPAARARPGRGDG